MGLQIVDEENFPTLATRFKDTMPPPAGDQLGEHALRNAPMHQAGIARRYEDIVPFTGNNFIGNIFNPSGSDAKLRYAQQAQKFNAEIDDNARRDALTELNIMKSIEATPPGKRDPQIKILQRFYQQRGKPFDPEIQKFYKTADANGFKASKWAAGEIKKANPSLNDNELWTAMNTDPALQVDWIGKMAEFQEQVGKAESQSLKNKRAKLMYERIQQMERGIEGSTGSQEPLQQAPVQQPSPGLQQAPMGSQMPQQSVSMPIAGHWSKERTVAQIRAEAQRQDVDPNLAVAVATQESYLNPQAMGDGGKSVGFFQLQPAAAQDVGMTPQQRLDPVLNIRGGVAYLKQKLDQSDGDVDKALLRYNGGGDPNYVQNVRKHLTAAPQERRAHIPTEQQNELTALERSISHDEKLAEILGTASGDPEIDKEHDNLMKRIDIKQKKAERLERKYGLKFDTNTFEGWLGAKYKTSPAQIPATVLPQLQEQYEEETGQRKAGQKRREALATQDLDLERARASNPGNILSATERLKYFRTDREGPMHPGEMGSEELAAANKTNREKTGRDLYEVRSPLEVKERQAGNTSIASVKGVDRILGYLDDPDVAKLVGTLMSNPEATVQMALGQIWPEKVPIKVREVAAEISNITSTILNARIGSAQTAAEFTRLAPLIGSMKSLSGDVLKAQMVVVRNALAEGFNTDIETLEGSGMAVPKNWKPFDLLETSLDREKQKATTAQTPDTKSATPKSSPALDKGRSLLRQVQ